MSDLIHKDELPDSWNTLRQFTVARIGLPATGNSINTKQMLAFQLDHAHARDAVYSSLNTDKLQEELNTLNLESHVVQSEAANREIYLQRPDLGRRLKPESIQMLNLLTKADVVFILADGLSAEAIGKNAIPVLRKLLPQLKNLNLTIAPIVIAELARVALADDIGSAFNAKLSLIFIGERPGLSSPDSMGVYITYNPKPGTTDESRNCISNIREKGLKHADAADKIVYFIKECLRLKVSGIQVKDLHGLLP